MHSIHDFIEVAVYILSFVVTFEAMKCVNYEKILKANHVSQAQILYYLMIVAFSYLVGSFVMIFIR